MSQTSPGGGGCPPGPGPSCQCATVEVLCDASGTAFNRILFLDADGVPTRTADFTLDGEPFTPTEPVGACSGGSGPSGPDAEVEMLCDDNGPFVRGYFFAGSTATVHDFTLAGAAYVTAGTVAPCAARPAATLMLCDDRGPFLRHYTYDATGAVIDTDDTTLAGVGMVPLGTVRRCEDAGPELVLLCDYNGSFLRSVLVRDDGSTMVADFTLDGDTYAAVGAVEVCDSGATVEIEQLCDDNGTFLRHLRYDASGSLTGFTDTDVDGTPWTVVGTVLVGCCGCSGGGADVEPLVLCDANGPFIRRYDSANPLSFADYTLASMPYTAVAPITVCGPVSGLSAQLLCDGAGVPFLRRYDPDDPTTFVDLTLEGAAFVPVDPVGTCSQVPTADCEQSDPTGCYVVGPVAPISAVLPFTMTITPEGGEVYGFHVLDVASGISQALHDCLVGPLSDMIDWRVTAPAGVLPSSFTVVAGAWQLTSPVTLAGLALDFTLDLTRLNPDGCTEADAAIAPTRALLRTLGAPVSIAADGTARFSCDTAHPAALVHTMAVPVTVCGPVAVTVTPAPEGGGEDVEQELLCDAVGTFLRHYRHSVATGAFIAFYDTDLAGLAYSPTGAVKVCPSGSTETPTFVFTQAAPSEAWVIPHTLPCAEPSVFTVNPVGVPIIGVVTFPNPNTVLVTFTSPVAGTAYLNC